MYQLIPYPEWKVRVSSEQDGQERDTKALDGFLQLCPANSLSRLGIIICNKVLSGTCPVAKAVFAYGSDTGDTGTFAKHTARHESKQMKVNFSQSPNRHEVYYCKGFCA